jgi:CBS domain containing-hemolysin-like protein
MVKYDNGELWARKFAELKSNIDKPLSAILSLNTVAHTVGAAGVGAEAVRLFGEASFGIVSAILTLSILVVTEIIPKTIGAKYWRNLARLSSYTIQFMINITYPLVLMSAVITKFIAKDIKEQTTSREEIAALADIGVREGIFSAKEHKIIRNLLRLKEIGVTEVMTPRVVIALADENMTLEDFYKNNESLKFSRIPVYSESEENITGYVFKQDAFDFLIKKRIDHKLKDVKRDIIAVLNSITLFTLLEKLIEKKEHIAIVVDEYGGLDGIVTMEDVIESLLGLEIIDETDTVIDMQKYARDKWKNQFDYKNRVNK